MGVQQVGCPLLSLAKDEKPMVLDWIVVVMQLVFLEGLLSIDNAAVLGAMVSSLPTDEPVPWPASLDALGDKLDPLLGDQRNAALKVGLLGAYAGRAAMLAAAHFVIQNPWLRLLGGAYLVYLAADHLAPCNRSEAMDRQIDASGKGFWQIVLSVELMDLVFSLDNVVAAVALSSHMAVVLLGVALGILTMRFAAGLFASLIQREPCLEPAAYVLVMVIGLRFIFTEVYHIEIPTTFQFGLSVLIILTTLLYAHFPALRVIGPIIAWCQQAMRLCLNLFHWVVVRPLALLANLVHSLWWVD
jgi:tellurite resistance protein TerC